MPAERGQPDELDKLITRLQELRREHATAEFTAVFLEINDTQRPHVLDLSKITTCEDDFEDSRGHGRACGRKQMFLYLGSEEDS